MTSTEAMNTEVALLKQSNKIMQTDIKEVKKNLKEHAQDQKEGFEKLEDKIEQLFNNLDQKFATKIEHKENRNDISSLRKSDANQNRILWFVGFAFLGAILTAFFKSIGLG